MNLTIRNIPEEVINSIKKKAEINRRSLNSEILILLESSLLEITKERQAEIAKKQMSALSKFVGKWNDDRSTKDIIADIYESRTVGSDVVL